MAFLASIHSFAKGLENEVITGDRHVAYGAGRGRKPGGFVPLWITWNS